MLDVAAAGLGDHPVLDLHPMFGTLPVQFHRLLLDAENLILAALHD